MRPYSSCHNGLQKLRKGEGAEVRVAKVNAVQDPSYQVEMATLELEKKELRQSLKQSNDHNQRVIQKIEDYKDEMKRLHAELELRNKESALYNNEHQRLIHETSRYKASPDPRCPLYCYNGDATNDLITAVVTRMRYGSWRA
eukprot:jgi/Bigna1/144704/aug1.90_g19412